MGRILTRRPLAAMMPWILLAVSLAFAGLGLLTVVKIPDRIDWRLTIIAGQFGYVLALVPLGAALVAWRLPGDRGPVAVSAGVVGAVAAALLVQPCAQAWIIGRSLPGKLERAFGAATIAGRPFTLGGLLSGWPGAAPSSTWAYSGNLLLDFFPAIGRSNAPCVIVIHGGGWNNGDRGQIPQFNTWLARSGYAVADISYRLAPGAVWPAQRDDVAAAIAFVKAHASEWSVDRSKLILFGRSAGGQIAEASAYGLHDPDVRGVVALYAPADMNFAWTWGREDDALRSPELLRQFLGGTPATAGPAYDSASAILLVGAATPPTLLVHGTIDTLVWNRQSERLAARLSEAGVPHLLVEMPWATHALEYNLGSPSGQLTTYSVAWFLATVCR
jgi:acetyl esterase/lipase